jgi:hypothetical protein
VRRPALTQTDNYKELIISAIIRVAMRSRSTSGWPWSCSSSKAELYAMAVGCRECSTAMGGGNRDYANAFTWVLLTLARDLRARGSRVLIPRGASAGAAGLSARCPTAFVSHDQITIANTRHERSFAAAVEEYRWLSQGRPARSLVASLGAPVRGGIWHVLECPA